MKRLLVLAVVVVAFTGCRCQTPPAVNPFVGPTTVPPPGTNIYSNGPPNQYYPGSLQITPPHSVVPQTVPGSGQPAAPGGAGNYAPPGGSFDYGGSSAPGFGRPIPSRSAMHLSPSPRPNASAGSTSDDKSTPAADRSPRPVYDGTEETEVVGIRRVEIPRSALASTQPVSTQPASTPAASTPGQPRLLEASEDAIDIADLPEASTPASRAKTQSGPDSEGFRLVSGTEESDGPAEVTAATGSSSDEGHGARTATFAPQTSYGRAPDYGWLRGKLEYSQIDRHWKLRYIPVEGKTDEFGGSVVFADTAALAGLERGDFVEVRGQLGQKDPKNGFAPTYEVAQAERLGKATP